MPFNIHAHGPALTVVFISTSGRLCNLVGPPKYLSVEVGSRFEVMLGQNIKLEHISDAAVSKAITEANKEGVFAGLSGGLASAVIGQRLLKFNRNTALFCGALTGALSGYFFAEAFRATAIAQLRAENARMGANVERTQDA